MKNVSFSATVVNYYLRRVFGCRVFFNGES